jgi:flagellar biosynthesis/type III secretory pathway chaperone
MDIVKIVKENKFRLLKIIGFVFLALLVLSFVVTLFGATFGNIRQQGSGEFAPSLSLDSYKGGYDYEESLGEARLSQRNASSTNPERDGSVGGDAEDYEVTNYRADIQARNIESTCGVIFQLKGLNYVVFEYAEESDNYCNYSFKVERERASEILGVIKDLNPRNLSENTRTIKKQVEDFTSEREILEAKQQSINETLESALLAYSEITALATNTGDAETLAGVINSRIQVIERLTQERINISAQLDRLSRAQAEALDGLDYTQFSVTVVERRFINLEAMGDSWQRAIEQFFLTVNKALQDATINVLAFLFAVLPYILYLFIIIVFAKYGWRLAKYVWEK